MSYILVDVEADGPISGDYSMISFGAVIVEPGLPCSQSRLLSGRAGFRPTGEKNLVPRVLARGAPHKIFYGKLRPISDMWVPEALKVRPEEAILSLGK